MKASRDAALAGFLVVALALGVAVDLLTDDVSGTASARVAPLFDARSVYCPAPPRVGESSSQLAIAAPGDEDVLVAIGDDNLELAAGRTSVRKNSASSSLIGYGGEIAAGVLPQFTGKVAGIGAASCSKVASTRWYFAEGSSSLGAEQRLVIYNPFPDEAVVGIALFTPDGPQGNASLAEGKAVPAGETLVVEINEFIRQERFVGASIVAKRGRVIAWRALQVSSEERPEGVQFSLGATRPSSEWFFPEGGLGGGLDERVSLLNPTDEEAVATVSLVTAEETLQPPELVEVLVPPQTLQPLPLRNYVGGSDSDLGGAGVVVRTSSGTLVAERTVYYDTTELSGVASEVGAVRTARRWHLPPSVSAPETDSVILLNPGATSAEVSLTLHSSSASPLQPDQLQGLAVEPGTRLKIPLGEWTRGQSLFVSVESDSGIVAERFGSKGGDVAALIGLPLAGVK